MCIRDSGCLAYYYINKKNDSELTGRVSLFFGFADEVRGYYFLDLETKQVTTSRTSIFNENVRPLVIGYYSMGLPIQHIYWPNMANLKERGLLSLNRHFLQIHQL